MARHPLRPSIEALVGYKPGEQPKPGQPIIKLNTNENPYPPSPQAIAALANLDPEALRRYPDPYATPFRQTVSDVLAVPPDWVLVGNGSDDILNIIIRACAEPGRSVVYKQPGLDDKLRITVGTPEQNQALLAALRTIIA